MVRIGELLASDGCNFIKDCVNVEDYDPETALGELKKYIATEPLKAAYESLFAAMAAAAKSLTADGGVWVSGFFGSGKSSFVKNVGYVLANREVGATRAGSLFREQVDSRRIAECVAFLNSTIPYEVFMFDAQANMRAQSHAEHIARMMYRVMLRQLDYAEDYQIAGLEIQLEKTGKLDAFQRLCRAEFEQEWQAVRKGTRRSVRTSALLHQLDPQTYASADTWLNSLGNAYPPETNVADLVRQMFDLCAARRPGKAMAFILDEMDDHGAISGECLNDLRAVTEQFGKESATRVKAGAIPGPVWIIVALQRTINNVYSYLPSHRCDLPKLRKCFPHQIDLSQAGIRELAARRVLRKRSCPEPGLRTLFRENRSTLMKSIRLERCSRGTEFSEDEFVLLYPYVPHLIDLAIDIAAGVRLHPHLPKHVANGNLSILKQCSEMVSGPTGVSDQPIGALVSIDKIYDLLEANLPSEKRQDIRNIGHRFDGDPDYPGLAVRVAKVLCLMEFVKTDLPRTTRNIAALLVRRVNEPSPADAVAAILLRLKETMFARETDDQWRLYGFDELRTAPSVLDQLNDILGRVNPRLPGLHNNLIQLVKKSIARSLTWYTRSLHEFNASLGNYLQGVIWTLEHLSGNKVTTDEFTQKIAALDQVSIDIRALELRLAQSETRNAKLAAALGIPVHDNGRTAEGPRTTYVIGLFGTGRRYLNELLTKNLGERAEYFRDTLRLHPGPTQMIYSGHATNKYVSRAQAAPDLMKKILVGVRSGFADLIFLYRHPLDSLLTNWVWWRTYLRDNRAISGISQIYANTSDLCDDLEENFAEFQAFAAGNPDFFLGTPGPRFLSFTEFVEETELHLASATLALRLEDFIACPSNEFSKIAAVMGVDLDLSRTSINRPRTKPYGYLTLAQSVARFREFIDGMDAETRDRITKMGYQLYPTRPYFGVGH